MLHFFCSCRLLFTMSWRLQDPQEQICLWILSSKNLLSKICQILSRTMTCACLWRTNIRAGSNPALFFLLGSGSRTNTLALASSIGTLTCLEYKLSCNFVHTNAIISYSCPCIPNLCNITPELFWKAFLNFIYTMCTHRETLNYSHAVNIDAIPYYKACER